MGLEEATNLEHALEMVEVCRSGLEYKQDIRPPSRDFIALGDRITELENRLSQLLSDAVPDKKWDKVFKGSAIDYLRHRAVHFIKNYGDPVRGARMNQLANELEEREKLFTELEAENEILLQQVVDRENWKAAAEEAWGRITELEKERDEMQDEINDLCQAEGTIW